jgi:hypothetical protein
MNTTEDFGGYFTKIEAERQNAEQEKKRKIVNSSSIHINQKPVNVETNVSPNFTHGDRAILINNDLAYEGQVVERTHSNSNHYEFYFIMPSRMPLQITMGNKTDMGNVYKISG